MQKQGQKKVCEFEAKVRQKGAKMEAKMHPKCLKGAKGALKGVKCWKKGMQKTMPKFDDVKKTFLSIFMDF